MNIPHDPDLREAGRIEALRQLELLDTPPSEAFDRITRMAARRLFQLPIAAVSLTDKDRQWFTTTTVGLVRFAAGQDAPLDVLRNLHSAAHDARDAESGLRVYSPEQDAAYRHRFWLISELGRALAQPGELHLVFQLKVSLRDGSCLGMEALLRQLAAWRAEGVALHGAMVGGTVVKPVGFLYIRYLVPFDRNSSY